MEIIDIVGMGGDGKNIFNIFIILVVVVVGVGYKVIKYGSYGVFFLVGFFNVLQELGYIFINDIDMLCCQFDQVNICFLYVLLFYLVMKEVVFVCKQLGMKIFFNMFGLFVNLVQFIYQLFGMFDLELLRLYQYIMQEIGWCYSIVYVFDGYDEVFLIGFFWLWINELDIIFMFKDLQVLQLQQQDLYGGDMLEEVVCIFCLVFENVCIEV